MPEAKEINLCTRHKEVEYSNLLETFFEESVAMYAIMDRDFNFIKVNNAYAAADNRGPSQFPGRNHFDLYPSDAELIFKEVVNTKKPYQVYARPFVYPHNPERGITYWDWTLAPIIDSNGEVDLLLFSLYNVTESVKATEELERFFTLSIDMLSIMDFEGKFLKVNPAFEKTLGYTSEELITMDLFDLTHLEDKKRTIHSIENAITSAEPIVYFENRLCCKDKTYRWLEWDGFTDKNKRVIYAIARDITERKKLEDEIQRLESLSLLGTLTAEINHEIRNPMASVRGFLQLLYNKEECKKYKEYFDLMISELDRANSIITDYLSLSRTSTVKLRKTNLNEVIRKLEPFLEANAMNSSNTLVIKFGEIPDVLLDEKLIRQLILNLVRNGLEAMDNSGILLVSTFYEGGSVVLAVQDHGSGIEQDILKKIGTPFLTTKNNGTGLGLSICYNIVKKHNATIDIDTGAEGTTFYIRFQTEKIEAAYSTY
ncbi:MAG: hypothetical protein APF76_15165 [Desulfitibacter sp. BRH_c19]|nr:MAG: hypothetical protein APF76_15165 [Desulfitibacter sp. BRH_c19]